jgi:hypothetical protein
VSPGLWAGKSLHPYRSVGAEPSLRTSCSRHRPEAIFGAVLGPTQRGGRPPFAMRLVGSLPYDSILPIIGRPGKTMGVWVVQIHGLFPSFGPVCQPGDYQP